MSPSKEEPKLKCDWARGQKLLMNDGKTVWFINKCGKSEHIIITGEGMGLRQVSINEVMKVL